MKPRDVGKNRRFQYPMCHFPENGHKNVSAIVGEGKANLAPCACVALPRIQLKAVKPVNPGPGNAVPMPWVWYPAAASLAGSRVRLPLYARGEADENIPSDIPWPGYLPVSSDARLGPQYW